MSAATVVIRGAGERTVDLCKDLLVADLAADCVVPIQEVPFCRAVERTFQIGVEQGRPWTAAIDADVLIRKGAIEDLVALAEACPQDLFELEGCILDRLFGGPRFGGVHLYRTEFLNEALALARQAQPAHRPEYSVICKMKQRGYRQERRDAIVGLHDYEQYHKDYFRKGASVARKFRHLLWFFKPMWERLAQTEQDFVFALAGLEYGIQNDGLALTDIEEAKRIIDEQATLASVAEKSHAIQRFQTPQDIAGFLADDQIQPEFRVWDAWRIAQDEASRIHRETVEKSLSHRMIKFASRVRRFVLPASVSTR